MLSQKPANCYNFSSWSSPDVTITNNSFVMPAKDVTVTANYTVIQYTVSAAPNNPSYGTVTGSDTYNCGSTATVTASAATNYIFVGWYESGSQVSTTATYAFTVNGNRTLEARFNPSYTSYTITIVYEAEKQPSSTIATVSKNQAQPGDSITLTINRTNISYCYIYGGWYSPDLGVNSPQFPLTYSYTFTMPANNVTIHVILNTNPSYSCW